MIQLFAIKSASPTGFFASEQFVDRRKVAQGTMQVDLVIFDNTLGDQSPGIVHREACPRPNTLRFDGAVISFELAIRLGIVREGPYSGHPADADRAPTRSVGRFEILGDELRAIVAVEHLVIQTSVPIEWMIPVEVENGPVFEPMGTRDSAVMFVHFAIPLFPSEKVPSGTPIQRRM